MGTGTGAGGGGGERGAGTGDGDWGLGTGDGGRGTGTGKGTGAGAGAGSGEREERGRAKTDVVYRGAGVGSGRVGGGEEPIARVHGRRVRELIDNDEAESYSAEMVRRTRSEEWREECRLEKRPRQEEEDVDHKLQKLRQQLLAELGAKENSKLSCPPPRLSQGGSNRRLSPRNS
ncbi:translation initiation factor IF-2-like [Manihot esculenta]|uniref:translation initiation factor IF-2-like n=1 Tax=Manihot esculenta TaxID=3983 RepID=UPI001CC5BA95|nr:translation initiation factor IF-2-like [Manihot esculenta]